jgi:hypothetical protein
MTAKIRRSGLLLRIRQARHCIDKQTITLETCALSTLTHSSERMTLLFATFDKRWPSDALHKIPFVTAPDTFLLALLVFPVLYSPVVTLPSCAAPYEFRPTNRLSLVRMLVFSLLPRKCRVSALNYMRYEVLAAVAIKTVSWNLTPCHLVQFHQRVRQTCCRYLQGTEIPWRWRQYVPIYHWYNSTQWHSVTYPKTVIYNKLRQRPIPFISFPIHPKIRSYSTPELLTASLNKPQIILW